MPELCKCKLCNVNMVFARLRRHIKTIHKNDIDSWENYLDLYIEDIPNYNRCCE